MAKEKFFNSMQELIDYHDAYILEGGDLPPMLFTYKWLPAQAPIWDYVNNQEAEMIMRTNKPDMIYCRPDQLEEARKIVDSVIGSDDEH